MFDAQSLVLVGLLCTVAGTIMGFFACALLCVGPRPPTPHDDTRRHENFQ